MAARKPAAFAVDVGLAVPEAACGPPRKRRFVVAVVGCFVVRVGSGDGRCASGLPSYVPQLGVIQVA